LLVCALLLWLVIIYFTFPETRGMTLEEDSQVFDGSGTLERTYNIKAQGLAEIDHTEKVMTERKEA
jgi:hypothetical protein